MNYGNGEFEPVSTSTLDTFILKEVMEIFQSIMNPKVGSDKFENSACGRKAKHQEEDGLESTEVENIESVSRIQNQEIIFNKGAGIDDNKFIYEDWAKLRQFYDRVEAEVRSKRIPTQILSLTEKGTQSKPPTPSPN